MSIQAMTWALQIRTGSPKKKAVLLVLADYADESGTCFPGHRRIADATEMSVRSVIRVLNELETSGFLTTEKRRSDSGQQATNRYILNLQGDRPTLGQSDTICHSGQGSRVTKSPVQSDKTGHSRVTTVSLAKEPPVEPSDRTEGDMSAKPTRSPEDWFEEMKRLYPKRPKDQGWKSARRKFLLAVRRGVDPELIIAGVRRYAAAVKANGEYGTEFVKMAQTWMHGEFWNEYQNGGAATGDPSDEELQRIMRA